MSDYKPNGKDFANVEFAENNSSLFESYIDYVVRGYGDAIAFRLVFGDELACDQLAWERIFGLQRNPYFIKNYKKRVDTVKMEELWNPKMAVINLVKMVRDATAKDSARLNAMRELNVIFGITTIDENGHTKLGRSMDDFYTKFESEVGKAPAEPKPTLN